MVTSDVHSDASTERCWSSSGDQVGWFNVKGTTPSSDWLVIDRKLQKVDRSSTFCNTLRPIATHFFVARQVARGINIAFRLVSFAAMLRNRLDVFVARITVAYNAGCTKVSRQEKFAYRRPNDAFGILPQSLYGRTEGRAVNHVTTKRKKVDHILWSPAIKILSGRGIISGPIWGSFPVPGSFPGGDHLRPCTGLFSILRHKLLCVPVFQEFLHCRAVCDVKSRIQ